MPKTTKGVEATPRPETNSTLTSSNLGDILPSDMRERSGSVTREQLERDLIRVRKDRQRKDAQIEVLKQERDKLDKQEAVLRGTLELYFPESATTLPEPADSAVLLDHLSIAEACAVLFREFGNEWLSLADLDNELRRRGKVCNKGSVELALKAEPKRFEVERRGKRNFYRMSDAVKDSRATKTRTGEP